MSRYEFLLKLWEGSITAGNVADGKSVYYGDLCIQLEDGKAIVSGELPGKLASQFWGNKDHLDGNYIFKSELDFAKFLLACDDFVIECLTGRENNIDDCCKFFTPLYIDWLKERKARYNSLRSSDSNFFEWLDTGIRPGYTDDGLYGQFLESFISNYNGDSRRSRQNIVKLMEWSSVAQVGCIPFDSSFKPDFEYDGGGFVAGIVGDMCCLVGLLKPFVAFDSWFECSDSFKQKLEGFCNSLERVEIEISGLEESSTCKKLLIEVGQYKFAFDIDEINFLLAVSCRNDGEKIDVVLSDIPAVSEVKTAKNKPLNKIFEGLCFLVKISSTDNNTTESYVYNFRQQNFGVSDAPKKRPSYFIFGSGNETVDAVKGKMLLLVNHVVVSVADLLANNAHSKCTHLG